MAVSATMQELMKRGMLAEKIVSQLRAQVDALMSLSSTTHKPISNEEAKLVNENTELKAKVVELKKKLVSLETERGIKQIPLPDESVLASNVTNNPSENNPTPTPKLKESKPISESSDLKKKDKVIKNLDKNKNSEKNKAPETDNLPIDVSRLDMRIGKIVDVQKHPDADSLFVEQVDLGEGKNRTIVSGLVKHVPIEEMQGRLAIFLCNLKAAKMRGILSEGMIMCGSSPEKVEIINLPAGASIGDKVTVPGYDGAPDVLLNPKKKIWEQVQPDLKIDENGVATYKGSAWKVGNIETKCTVPSMRNTGIK